MRIIYKLARAVLGYMKNGIPHSNPTQGMMYVSPHFSVVLSGVGKDPAVARSFVQRGPTKCQKDP